MSEKTASDYALEFSQKHPEVGEMAMGSRISPEAFGVFRDLLVAKGRVIIDKGLGSSDGSAFATTAERAFVRSSADMLVRTLFTAVEDYPAALASPAVHEAIVKVIGSAYMSSYDKPREREWLGTLGQTDLENRGNVTKALDTVVHVIHGISSADVSEFNIHSSNLIDITNASGDALQAVAEQQGGFPVSNYLQGNLQNVIAQYELVDK